MNKKIIHSQKVAGYLMLKGFVILGIEDNLKDKWRKVFLFNESQEIDKALGEYKLFFERNKKYIIREII